MSALDVWTVRPLLILSEEPCLSSGAVTVHCTALYCTVHPGPRCSPHCRGPGPGSCSPLRRCLWSQCPPCAGLTLIVHSSEFWALRSAALCCMLHNVTICAPNTESKAFSQCISIIWCYYEKQHFWLMDNEIVNLKIKPNNQSMPNKFHNTKCK